MSKSAVIIVRVRPRVSILDVVRAIRRMENIREARVVNAVDFDIYVLAERNSEAYLDRLASAISYIPNAIVMDWGADQEF